MTGADDRPRSAPVATRILLGTFSADLADPLHLLIRAARAGDRTALSEVVDRLRLVAWTAWPEIDSAVIIAVPGHRPGPANPLILEAAGELAVIRGWSHARDALRRCRAVPEAKSGRSRDALGEATTMEWASAGGGDSILLLDDVIRTGLTLQGCAAAIRATGDQRRVVGLAIAARSTD